MKTKIKIKSIFEKILFEFEKEDNTIKDTVIEAVKYGANLTGANLFGADLTGANLNGANLYGATLSGIKISKCTILSGLYKYVVIPFIAEDGIHYVKMGCFTRKVSEWNDDFWNNDNEFPNDGSIKSNLRLMAFDTACKWLNINK